MAVLDGELSLGLVGRALWRNKRWIIGPVLIVTALAFVGVNLITPRYKSEARVLVEGRENIFLRPEADKAMMDRTSVDAETVTSQVQLVLSRDLAREVIDELHLTDVPEFNAALRGFSPLSVLRTIGILKDPMAMAPEERVLAAYYDRLNAYAVDKSRVIVIEFQSSDPDLAARIANTIGAKYLTFQQVAKQDQARSASRWLSGELDKLRDKVSEAEGNVEAYRAKSNLFVGSNNSSLAGQQLSELSSQVSAARAQKADAESRAHLIRDAIKAGRSLESLDIANSELIRRLSEQRVTLRAQLAEQSSTLLSQHPRIKEMRAQIGDLDQQIISEGQRLARSLENEAKVAGARLDSLSASLDALKRQNASTSDQDVQLRALEREAKAQRDLFESYLAKYREATARDSISAAPADARIISRATVSNVPFFPKKIPIMLIAALGTLALASAFVVTSALLNPDPYRLSAEPVPMVSVPTFVRARLTRSPRSRTRASDSLPPVTNVPLSPEDVPVASGDTPPSPEDVPVSPEGEPLSHDDAAMHQNTVQPDESTAEAETTPDEAASIAQRVAAGSEVDDIAAALQHAGESGRAIAVIGSSREVGATTTAIALGRSLARNSRAVLLDLALTAPSIDSISDEPDAPGVADLVHGAASFENILTKDRLSRLHLVTTGDVGDDIPGLLNSQMLQSAVGALKQSYDHVVIDAGVYSEASLPAIAEMATRAFLIGGDAPIDDLRAAAADLRAAGFVYIAVLTGPPPPLDHAALQSTAA